ncbi:coiled-coil domain-containing protein [Actinomadura harenae]|uniref:Uncharacterized protein n=1 Tax=Actinomadura harenae TaxID=2483351 RepID=A0A3M2LT32_9ACTN|nr:hypothetical protein [Actinomadura harenae]RMI40649.1 hypothetical protein EBO15_25595 [Actinomadura harenae]
MDETERLRERVGELCATLTERYERLEAELLEAVPPEAEQPLGWSGRIATLRVFAMREPTDDWTDLARLMVEPETLDERVASMIDLSGEDAGAAVRQITDALDGRILLLAPSRDEAAELLEALAGRELPLMLEEVVPPPPFRRRVHNGTVEFRSMTESATEALRPVPDDPDVTVSDLGTLRLEVIPDAVADALDGTRADPVPAAEKTRPNKIVSDEALASAVPVAPEVPGPEEEAAADDRPVEEVVRRIVVRPVGGVWREDWERELRGLQLGLLWLEQWPRDVATVERLEVEGVQRREERRADIAALEAALVDRRAELVTAGEAVTAAEAERERTAAEEEQVAGEAVEPRQEAVRLRAEADGIAAKAAEAAGVADEAYARVTAIDQRASQAQYELSTARQQEQQLIADLARAREELPAAQAETERLVSEDSTAMAEGHASYYRVRAAESAVAAVRGKMTLTQRLHVAPGPPELKQLRADLKAKVQQADDAVKRAHETKEAAERAAHHQAGLEHFLENGAERLAAAKHAQVRLADELTRLAEEREGAVETHREQARTAAEAADRATQAGASARYAEQTARAAEERLAVARTAREIAEAALERAESDVASSTNRISQGETALAERRANTETENAEDETDLAVAIEAEARSRDQVAAISGEDEPDTGGLPDVQARAMTRIEELTGLLAALADSPHDAESAFARTLLGRASVVGGSPFAISSGDPGQFDELVVSGTERLGPDDLLIGATHARRWTLLTTPTTPEPAPEPAANPLEETVTDPVEDTVTDAPSEPTSVPEEHPQNDAPKPDPADETA